MSLKSSIGSPAQIRSNAAYQDPNSSQPESALNMWGRQKSNNVKTRSNNAMFGGESLV